MGDPQNTLLVLNAYKAYETGNVDDALKYFADTVHIVADNFDRHLPKDSMAAMIKAEMAGRTTKLRMGDWESVISKDKKTQYVSLWYVQTMTDKSGKVDSIYMMDDVEIKDGKIVSIDGKQRRFPDKKM